MASWLRVEASRESLSCDGVVTFPTRALMLDGVKPGGGRARAWTLRCSPINASRRDRAMVGEPKIGPQGPAPRARCKTHTKTHRRQKPPTRSASRARSARRGADLRALHGQGAAGHEGRDERGHLRRERRLRPEARASQGARRDAAPDDDDDRSLGVEGLARERDTRVRSRLRRDRSRRKKQPRTSGTRRSRSSSRRTASRRF